MKALLIDDEQDSHDVLSMLLRENHPEISIKGNAYSVEEGVQLIERLEPELLFLDIEMPDGTGFDLLHRFDRPNFQIIFVTAFNQYAQTAIRLGALDYLTKPVDKLELKAALLKSQIKQLEIQVAQLEIIRDTMSKVMDRQLPLRMSISTQKGVLYFPTADVIRLEAMQNFTELIVDQDKRRLIASVNLKKFEDDLRPYHQFMRVHRSYIVNLQKAIRLSKGDHFALEMKDGFLVPVGKKYRENVVKRMGQYLL